MDEQEQGQAASTTKHEIKGFKAFFEKQKEDQWCVIAAATMCGNFLNNRSAELAAAQPMDAVVRRNQDLRQQFRQQAVLSG